jgi:hypothetical protein
LCQNWRAPQSLDRTPTFRPVAGREADMDVNTVHNTARNGLHFWLHVIIFCCLFFLGAVPSLYCLQWEC